ncbi:hypothetical protein P9112_013790 [Eukaryota sp. TZLM1-RC]
MNTEIFNPNLSSERLIALLQDITSLQSPSSIEIPLKYLTSDPTQTNVVELELSPANRAALASIGLSAYPLLSYISTEVCTYIPQSYSVESATQLFQITEKWLTFLLLFKSTSPLDVPSHAQPHLVHLLARYLSAAEYLATFNKDSIVSTSSFFITSCQTLSVDPSHVLLTFIFPDLTIDFLPSPYDSYPFLSSPISVTPVILKGVLLSYHSFSKLSSLLYVLVLFNLIENHGLFDHSSLLSYFSSTTSLPSTLDEAISLVKQELPRQPSVHVLESGVTFVMDSFKEEEEEEAVEKDLLSLVNNAAEDNVNVIDADDLEDK